MSDNYTIDEWSAQYQSIPERAEKAGKAEKANRSKNKRWRRFLCFIGASKP